MSSCAHCERGEHLACETVAKQTVCCCYYPWIETKPDESAAWDRWYGTLPGDLKRKLSVYDLRRLGLCFQSAFSAADPRSARAALAREVEGAER